VSAHVLGLDLGLATAGAAQIHHDGRVYTQALTTDALGADAPIAAVAARIRRVARWAVQRATTATVLVVIEGPAHAAQHGQPHERAGVWWRVVDQLVRHERPVAVLSPSTVKGYMTGNGNADKDLVRSAVAAAWPGHGLARASSHECDAVALATAGVDWLGWPGPWLEGRRGAKALLRAQWPDLPTPRTELPIP
jgi:Holliday junction resolvasome RuvABC endonuclease subunit